MESFNVFIDGACLPGFDIADVVPQLARMTGQPEERARRLLAGKTIQVKSNVDATTSERFVQALRRIGVAAHAEPDRLELDADFDVPALMQGGASPSPAQGAAAAPHPAAEMLSEAPPASRQEAPPPRAGPSWTTILSGASLVLGLFFAGRGMLGLIAVESSPFHVLAQYLPERWFKNVDGATTSSANKGAPSARAGTNAADQLIADRLKAPATYRVVQQDVLWSASNGAQDAYIVRTEFDAQNGFGAMLRGCYYATFKVEGGQIRYSPVHALSECDKGEMSLPFWKQMVAVLTKAQLEANDLGSYVTDDMEYAAEAAMAVAAGKPSPPRKPATAGQATTSPAPATAAARNPNPAVATKLDTPDRYDSRFALITADARPNLARVLVGGKVALETPLGEYSFEWVLETPGSVVVLVANFRPIGMGCLETYALLTVTETRASVSPRFGGCSNEPTVTADGDAIVVTQKDDDGKAHAYRWRAGKLTDNGVEVVER